MFSVFYESYKIHIINDLNFKGEHKKSKRSYYP